MKRIKMMKMNSQYLEAYDCICDINENNDDKDIDDIIIRSSRPYSLSDAQNRLFFMVYNAVNYPHLPFPH